MMFGQLFRKPQGLGMFGGQSETYDAMGGYGPQAAPAMGSPAGGGFQMNNPQMAMMGLGMLSGRNNAESFSGAMKGAMAAHQMQPTNTTTSDLMEFAQAKKDGFEGSFIDFKQAQLAPQKNETPSGFRSAANGGLEYIPGGPADPAYKRATGDRQQAPSGYRYENPDDPNSALVAIEGGPGQKIDAEVAARLGLSKSFLEDLPAIRDEVKGGGATGYWDHAMGSLGAGQQGRIHARIQSGVDALLRNLTGAGMTTDEAAKYAKRYAPTMHDNEDTLASKLDQLERELRSTAEVLGRGRGGDGFMPKAQGTQTSSGVKWKVVQ